MKYINSLFFNSRQFKNTFVLLLCSIWPSILSAQTGPTDINGDGELNILIIGTNESIKDGAEAFSPDQITIELQNILSADTSITVSINIVAEDIYRTKNENTGVANMFNLDLDYYCHSLVQYYYWPDEHSNRMDNLMGDNGTNWDYVVIGADPHMIANLPGYYALGINKIATKVTEGGAVPLLLMPWPKEDELIPHFEEFTYRTSEGAKVPLENVPAGLAWNALPDIKKDIAITHPTPNGAYVSAASIYTHILNRSASWSLYEYDDVIADLTETALTAASEVTHYDGPRTFDSPYKSCEIGDTTLIYNQGGTSTEAGILYGLTWVATKADKTLEFSTDPPIHFNYGRSSMGGTHLYVVDPSLYDYSFGYPLQDDNSTGLISMQYGIDQRVNDYDVETDLGVALDMVRESEVPYARNVPLRTIISQMIEEIPGVDIYPFGDPWHLSDDVNKAIGSYMYTMLTSDCACEGEEEPSDSTEWRTWMAHKIGYITAWNVMYMEGHTPCYGSILSIEEHVEPELDYVVYPNPTTGNFSIDLKDNYNAVTVRIINLIGKQILMETFEKGQQLNFFLNGPAGIYLVIIESEDKKSVIKLVKE
ncbi:MAG: hypothetical protein ACI8ZM_004148 [Crocinitomix sp.]|jgi:hypothetical protein